MTVNAPRRFRWKVFASLYIATSTLVIGASGLVLFVAPPGRIANWSDWTMAGLSKAQWQAVHTCFAFLFLIVAALHVYFNWRALLGYLRALPRNKELWAATGASLAVVVLVMGGWPPFGSLMELGDSARQSWADNRTEPPIPHAESMSLERLCRLTGRDLDAALAHLADRGILAGPDATVGALAARHGMTPQQLFERLAVPPSSRKAASDLGGHSPGLGRKTVGQVCSQLGLDLATALAHLRRHGIDAEATDRLRALALAAGRSPSDLVALMQAS